MAENEKLKILYLMQILMEETDKNHILNAIELCDILENRYGISSSRKTIYSDVERLKEYGVKIEQLKGKNQGYQKYHKMHKVYKVKIKIEMPKKIERQCSTSII